MLDQLKRHMVWEAVVLKQLPHQGQTSTVRWLVGSAAPPPKTELEVGEDDEPLRIVRDKFDQPKGQTSTPTVTTTAGIGKHKGG